MGPIVKVSSYSCKTIIILIFGLFVFSSCESLPDGDPPDGPIVEIDNDSDQVISLKSATNKMITALATSAELAVGNEKSVPNVIPGPSNIPETYRTQLAMAPINVYSELLTMGVLNTDPSRHADYILSSTFVKLIKFSRDLKYKSAFKWEISLSKIGVSRPSWTYSLKIFLNQ